jgi:hypoxanthine phosphoribosyltransferase
MLKELITKEQIKERVKGLSLEINAFFGGKSYIVIGVLKGVLFFMADLLKNLENYETYDFIQAKSYIGKDTTGNVKILKEPNIDIYGKDVLVIEDILDTGITANAIKDYLNKKGAKNIYFCTFLDKPSRRIKPITPHFCGYTIDNLFVVGYGLDFNEQFRSREAIYVLETDVTSF